MKKNKLTSTGNMAELLAGQIERNPDRVALRIPTEWNDTAVTRYDTMTFGEMGRRIARYQEGFRNAGYRPGDRIIIMVPPGVELYCLIGAMLASRIVPVLVDAGMGFGKMLMAFADSRARAIISIKKFGRFRYILPRLWRYRFYSVDGSGPFIRPVGALEREGRDRIEIVPCDREAHGIITFTSGSTGRPKGADRKHWSMLQQHISLRKSLPDRPGDIDMTCFPVMVLQSLGCGVPSVLAAVDFRAVGSVEPALIVDQIAAFGPTRLSAAPAFMKRLAEYIVNNGIAVPSLRCIATGGAPVSRELCRLLVRAFPRAEVRVLYGSTEAEPISSVTAGEIARTRGGGYLVGRPYPFVTVRIVDLPADPEAVTDHTLKRYALPAGGIGEIAVSGEHVLRGYVDNPDADRENKIHRPGGGVWHRTGDTGYRDRAGRLWITGRMRDIVRHRGKVIHPFLVEQDIDALPGVSRSALVAASDGAAPILAVALDAPERADEVMAAVSDSLVSSGYGDFTVRTVVRIPVDRRHNSKIDRAELIKLL